MRSWESREWLAELLVMPTDSELGELPTSRPEIQIRIEVNEERVVNEDRSLTVLPSPLDVSHEALLHSYMGART